MRKIRCAIAAAFCLASLMPAASAYDCKQPRDFEEEAARAQAIFEGRLARIEKVPEGYQVIFVVEQPWKGAAPEQEMAVSAKTLGGTYGSCTDELKVDERYLVYVHGRPGALAFEPCGRGVGKGDCDRTRVLKFADEDLLALSAKFGGASGETGNQ